MKFTQLGTTDLIVSRLCFGCWQLSPKFWGEVALDPWKDAIRQSLDAGINFIDTADAYGEGYAEECLGEFLKKENLRDKFIIATKFYWNFTDPNNRYPDTRYEYILKACEDSLRRLQVECIDLYQMHSWDAITRPDEVAAAIGKLKKEGKIRYFGVSNQNVEQMRLYQKHLPVDCLQPPYSLMRREIETSVLPHCLEHNMGVIPYSPLFRGLLGGKYKEGHKFGDTRDDHPMYQGEPFRILLDAIEEAKAMAADLDLTMAQLATRWLLTHPAITSTIAGVKKPEHMTTLLKAVEEPLSQQQWHQLANLFASARKRAEAAAS